MPPQSTRMPLELPLQLPIDTASLGVILVDHGSRRGESNELLLEVVGEFAAATGLPIVEPAHMELAEPSIATAFTRAVERGARMVVVFPYFLLPGRHWHEDIPRLAAEAARSHPGVQYLVTAPFGLHPLISEVISQRIAHCLAHARGEADACDACGDSDHCQLRGDAQ
jgi:sirohydrochlorin ferrochelatase